MWNETMKMIVFILIVSACSKTPPPTINSSVRTTSARAESGNSPIVTEGLQQESNPGEGTISEQPAPLPPPPPMSVEQLCGVRAKGHTFVYTKEELAKAGLYTQEQLASENPPKDAAVEYTRVYLDSFGNPINLLPAFPGAQGVTLVKEYVRNNTNTIVELITVYLGRIPEDGIANNSDVRPFVIAQGDVGEQVGYVILSAGISKSVSPIALENNTNSSALGEESEEDRIAAIQKILKLYEHNAYGTLHVKTDSEYSIKKIDNDFTKTLQGFGILDFVQAKIVLKEFPSNYYCKKNILAKKQESIEVDGKKYRRCGVSSGIYNYEEQKIWMDYKVYMKKIHGETKFTSPQPIHRKATEAIKEGDVYQQPYVAYGEYRIIDPDKSAGLYSAKVHQILDAFTQPELVYKVIGYLQDSRFSTIQSREVAIEKYLQQSGKTLEEVLPVVASLRSLFQETPISMISSNTGNDILVSTPLNYRYKAKITSLSSDPNPKIIGYMAGSTWHDWKDKGKIGVGGSLHQGFLYCNEEDFVE